MAKAWPLVVVPCSPAGLGGEAEVEEVRERPEAVVREEQAPELGPQLAPGVPQRPPDDGDDLAGLSKLAR